MLSDGGISVGESMSSSSWGTSGEGDGCVVKLLYGALCGRGDISMESGTKHGEESGIGGVVTPSHLTGGVVTSAAGRLAFVCRRGQCTATYSLCLSRSVETDSK